MVGIGLWSSRTVPHKAQKPRGCFRASWASAAPKSVRCWSVYIGRGHREVKIPLCSVTHSSVRGGRRRSCWLIRATRVLWRHTKSHEPRWSIGSGMLLYSLSPLSAFLNCSNSCSFFFFPVICCYILPLFELPIIWFSFSLVLFFFFFLFSLSFVLFYSCSNYQKV